MTILKKYEKEFADILSKYGMDTPNERVRSSISSDISELLSFPVQDITTYEDISSGFMTYAVLLPDDTHILKINF